MSSGLIYRVLNFYHHYTVNEGYTQQLPCIFPENHENDDKSKSARVYSDTELYYCFKCGITLDAIGLVRELEECTYKTACEHIETVFGVKVLKEKRIDHSTVCETYGKLIIKSVIIGGFNNFNRIYREMDKAIKEENVDKLKWLFEGVKDGRVS